MGERRGWAAGRGLTWLLLKAWAVSLLRPHCEQTKSPADLRQSLPLSATSGRYVASIPARLLRLLLPLLPSDPRPPQRCSEGQLAGRGTTRAWRGDCAVVTAPAEWSTGREQLQRRWGVRTSADCMND